MYTRNHLQTVYVNLQRSKVVLYFIANYARSFQSNKNYHHKQMFTDSWGEYDLWKRSPVLIIRRRSRVVNLTRKHNYRGRVREEGYISGQGTRVILCVGAIVSTCTLAMWDRLSGAKVCHFLAPALVCLGHGQVGRHALHSNYAKKKNAILDLGN